jgi:hypothetical protein
MSWFKRSDPTPDLPRAFGYKTQWLAVQARRRDGLLGRRATAPVLDQLIEARPHGVEHRPASRCLLPEHRLRLGHVLANRVAAHTELVCHDPLTLPFHEHLVPNNVNAIHPEHPSSRRCRETLNTSLHTGPGCPGWITFERCSGSVL